MEYFLFISVKNREAAVPEAVETNRKKNNTGAGMVVARRSVREAKVSIILLRAISNSL